MAQECRFGRARRTCRYHSIPTAAAAVTTRNTITITITAAAAILTATTTSISLGSTSRCSGRPTLNLCFGRATRTLVRWWPPYCEGSSAADGMSCMGPVWDKRRARSTGSMAKRWASYGPMAARTTRLTTPHGSRPSLATSTFLQVTNLHH